MASRPSASSGGSVAKKTAFGAGSLMLDKPSPRDSPTAASSATEPTRKELKCLSRSPDTNRVIVGGISVLKILGRNTDGEWIELQNVREKRKDKNDLSAIDVSWNQQDANFVATAAVNGNILVWDIAKSS